LLVPVEQIPYVRQGPDEEVDVPRILMQHQRDATPFLQMNMGGLLKHPTGCGKCVGGSTIIGDMTGTRYITTATPILRVPTVDAPTLTVGVATAARVDLEATATLRLQTSTGIVLEGTPEHPLLVWDGAPTWKRLDEIQPGDHVLLLPGYAKLHPDYGTSGLDPEEAYLIGLFMGNGCRWWSVKKGLLGLMFSTGYPEIAAAYVERVRQFWGGEVKHGKGGPDRVPGWRVYGPELAASLATRFPGLVCATAWDKYVPPAVMSGTPEIVLRFLQGLFDTDGGVTGTRAVEWL
jgi:hypothetical protein